MTLPPQHSMIRAEAMMREAITLARTTPPADIPVGAIIYGPDGTILGRGTNRRETDHNPLGHAEIMAITQACTQRGDGWRLTDCTLAVTLEPCTMCAGALVGSRIGHIIFGAYEPKTGACGSAFDVVRDPAVLHTVQVRGGILETECAELMTNFFGGLRTEA
ncbi:nucleoside deaminase [Corynebacterium diphtheriae]|uniref:nucleoside deaminase n=1 Tax=Corynebacterium diphtheriae TaxID=1717 RepID=UPI001D157B92|nr:nucleoside deaminase [Corynebacterium diphtheriae]UEB76781.1 nucleoside deaminase [Corynebacterium diphtheriae]